MEALGLAKAGLARMARLAHERFGRTPSTLPACHPPHNRQLLKQVALATRNLGLIARCIRAGPDLPLLGH